jgi:hypothetical protein
MIRNVMLAACLFAFVGCGNSEQAKLSKPTESPTWDALKGLQTAEGMMGISLNVSMGNLQGVRDHVQTPKFQELVTKFAAEPIPAKFKTPEREAAKAELDKHFQALIEGAKGNAADDALKTEAEATMQAFQKVASVPDAAAAG